LVLVCEREKQEELQQIAIDAQSTFTNMDFDLLQRTCMENGVDLPLDAQEIHEVKRQKRWYANKCTNS